MHRSGWQRITQTSTTCVGADYDEALLTIEVADATWGPESKFCAFGHASGGAIAAAAAAAFPHRCIALVAFESTLGLAGTGWADGDFGFSRLNKTYREDKRRRTAAPLRILDLEAAAEILPAPASLQTSRGLLRRQFRRESSDGAWLRTGERWEREGRLLLVGRPSARFELEAHDWAHHLWSLGLEGSWAFALGSWALALASQA